jgi:hypothetical protein
MLGSARLLKPRAVCHVATTGLRLSRGHKCMRTGLEPTTLGPDTCRHWTPAWVLFKARVCSVLRPWDPIVGGPDPIPGVRLAHVEVLDQLWRSGLYIQRSGTLPWGTGFTVDILEYITSFGHVAAPDPTMWALLWTQSCHPRRQMLERKSSGRVAERARPNPKMRRGLKRFAYLLEGG